ncbi:MAG: hypothetical protein C4320_07270, partial [Armatimonadota bacterium]
MSEKPPKKRVPATGVSEEASPKLKKITKAKPVKSAAATAKAESARARKILADFQALAAASQADKTSGENTEESGETAPSPEEIAEAIDAATDDGSGRPAVPDILPLLPLRDSVIFPMLIAPLSVGRESSVRLLDETLAGPDRIIGVVAQTEPTADEPGPDGVHHFGCAVIIRTLMKMPDSVRLIVQGVARFRVVEFLQEQPYLKARVEVFEELPVVGGPEGDEEIEALRRSAASLFEIAVGLSPNLPDELKSLTGAVQETNVMADLIAAHMSLDLETKQAILQTLDLKDRLRLLVDSLARESR